MPAPSQPGELFAHAESRVQLARYEALLGACSNVMDQTLGDLMASGAEALKQQFASLTIGEVLNGLALVAHAEVGDRPIRRAQTGRQRQPSAPLDDRQTELLVVSPTRRSPSQIAEFDAQVLATISNEGSRGVSRNTICTALGTSTSSVREALKRLRAKGLISRLGTTRSSKYRIKEKEGLPNAWS